jgi:glycosyltransferase involved in cell wall biosynthesis
MKIALLTPHNPDKIFGGVENIVRVMRDKLQERGHEVGVFHSTDLLPKQMQVTKSLSLLKDVRRLNEYDVVHSHSWAGCINNLLKAPSINTCHGSLAGWLKAVGPFIPAYVKLAKQFVTLSLEKRSYSCSDLVASISKSTRDELIGLYGIPEGKIREIFIGVDTGYYKQLDQAAARESVGFGKFDRIVLTTGRMDLGQKGLDMYEEIILSLKEEKFTPIINGTIMKGSEKYVPGNVVLNLIPIREVREKLPLVYNSADVFVQTSRYEGCSGSLLEAIACGIPCVAFDTGSAAEVIQDGVNGYVIPRYDTKMFAEKVKDILHDGTFKKRAAEHNRGLEKAISLDTMIDKYVMAYRELA